MTATIWKLIFASLRTILSTIFALNLNPVMCKNLAQAFPKMYRLDVWCTVICYVWIEPDSKKWLWLSLSHEYPLWTPECSVNNLISGKELGGNFTFIFADLYLCQVMVGWWFVYSCCDKTLTKPAWEGKDLSGFHFHTHHPSLRKMRNRNSNQEHGAETKRRPWRNSSYWISLQGLPR